MVRRVGLGLGTPNPPSRPGPRRPASSPSGRPAPVRAPEGVGCHLGEPRLARVERIGFIVLAAAGHDWGGQAATQVTDREIEPSPTRMGRISPA